MASWTVLVVGAGAREHALASRLLACDSVASVVVNPGNGGTRGAGLTSRDGPPLSVARDVQPDLVVIGPEQPLCDGVADALRNAGFVVYGPSQAAARLEASKSFMKEFAVRHGIRTARHVTLSDEAALTEGLLAFALPPVVKATGLCAGKGVVVCDSFGQAEAAARSMLSGAAFGEAGRSVVLEERLFGQEVSVHAVCDGERALLLPPIQDHKRIGDGDAGPNTGGMGTYGPTPVVSKELWQCIERDVVARVVAGMGSEGSVFRGTLFANMMITEQGDALLLEINVRFGDPETQVLVNLIDGDLARLLHSAATGNLEADTIEVAARHGLCVVLAAAGYPGKPRFGDAISGLDEALAVPGVSVYHAGTRAEGNAVVTAGGRVLSVTATDRDLRAAHARAYEACQRIRFQGMQYRRDIGHRVLGDHV